MVYFRQGTMVGLVVLSGQLASTHSEEAARLARTIDRRIQSAGEQLFIAERQWSQNGVLRSVLS
jgi:hypothetical protein